MELVTPAFGLVFWMSITFLTVLLLLKKFAWKPILNMIKEREESIEKALSSAEKAKNEMASLKASNEKILSDAKLERDALLKEARELKESMINEAKGKASAEADKIVAAARETIANEKLAAITELKNQVATLSIEVAEKVLRQSLANDEKQKAYVKQLLDEVKLN
ncbi:MAG: F0F1 ATP synthase subunit B [Bacteroidetes bacterium]|jgi:F-type H+-transporting ATPase subunit b|nr:F0F1 ATP synthase subunit B [Bacteroidota bacterium]MBP6412879.1 F0F1 ATP synthase subunit B [Bacteroidia bacterium]MBK9671691.1 F0F1 ATP synthase subunit B [Bacteroidota bacterium]MBK9798785.1 F0F1 ATP synthase subunit B [Bacteroidota bacterium]HRH02096.1 F0F1 ATP synthase subunit B [Bacteroidia bacterium]